MKSYLAAAALAWAVLIPVKASASPPTLVLEKWFKGPSTARGCFTNRIDGSKRCLSVKLVGKWNGKTLTLVEDFRYDDGEKDRKTWRFTKTGPGTYTGTREDVIGPAKVFTENGKVRLQYTATVGGRNLTFDDTLSLRADGTVLNTAVVYYTILPVADIVLEFKRGR